MIEKIKELFTIQDNLNKVLCGENYLDKHLPFYRAAYVEAAELCDHCGYKWWKAPSNFNLYQAQLEVIDILHFIIGHTLSTKQTYDNDLVFMSINSAYKDSKSYDRLFIVDKFVKFIESGSVYTTWQLFFSLAKSFELDFDEMYKIYINKNALNYFRNKNGYTDGTYIKMWKYNGSIVEDNVVLENIANSLDNPSFTDIYSALEECYKENYK